MIELPFYCPVCGLVLQNTETEDESIRNTCIKNHYSTSSYEIKEIRGTEGVFANHSELILFKKEQSFGNKYIAVRVFYLNDKIVLNQIDLDFVFFKPFKIMFSFDIESFNLIFSRDNLHPLLQKLEILEVFS